MNPSTLPGLIKWVAHDPQAAFVDPQGMYDYIGGYWAANSYGRNAILGSLMDDCVELGGGLATWADPDRIDYTVNCPPVVGTWDPYVMLHESCHCLKIGEGSSIDASGAIDPYGDKYSIMGRQGASGHLPAFYKERIGWLGGPDSLRGITLVGGSGTYPLTDIESASSGVKALKIMRNRTIEYRTSTNPDGTHVIYSDKIEYFYLEMRVNHTFQASGGVSGGHGGRKKRVSTTYVSAPGVQFRTGVPVYFGQNPLTVDNVVRGYLQMGIGYGGGLAQGQSYSFRQDTASEIGYSGIWDHIYKDLTVTITQLTTAGALVSVAYA